MKTVNSLNIKKALIEIMYTMSDLEILLKEAGLYEQKEEITKIKQEILEKHK